MPWAAAAAVAGAVITSEAQGDASDAQVGAANASRALSADQFNRTEARNAPFYQGGIDALQILQRNLPGMTSAYDPNKLTSEPGYAFGLAEGQKALERSLAARGAGGGGAALKAAARYGTDYGTTKLNDAFTRQQSQSQQTYNQLMGLINVGQSSANQTAAAGGQYAAQGGAALQGAGDAQAAAGLAQAGTFSNLLNQGASMYGRSQRGGGGGTGFGVYQPGVGSVGAGGSPDGYWADGGPVEAPRARKEPRVGSRSPLPGGGGGGLSREAVRAALDAASAPPALPAPVSNANPLNPRSVNAEREKAAGLKNGGEVSGPGGPRDDMVHAALSDGEHVWDAEAVTALGDGDNAKGQELLNQMRTAIKKHAVRSKGNKGRKNG